MRRHSGGTRRVRRRRPAPWSPASAPLGRCPPSSPSHHSRLPRRVCACDVCGPLSFRLLRTVPPAWLPVSSKTGCSGPAVNILGSWRCEQATWTPPLSSSWPRRTAAAASPRRQAPLGCRLAATGVSSGHPAAALCGTLLRRPPQRAAVRACTCRLAACTEPWRVSTSCASSSNSSSTGRACRHPALLAAAPSTRACSMELAC